MRLVGLKSSRMVAIAKETVPLVVFLERTPHTVMTTIAIAAIDYALTHKHDTLLCVRALARIYLLGRCLHRPLYLNLLLFETQGVTLISQEPIDRSIRSAVEVVGGHEQLHGDLGLNHKVWEPRRAVRVLRLVVHVLRHFLQDRRTDVRERDLALALRELACKSTNIRTAAGAQHEHALATPST